MLKTKIIEKIEEKKEKIIELLGTLIKIPSLTGEERDAQAFVEGYLKKLGMKVDGLAKSQK
jgi:acetylornithine deacetylase/succinyl-diaminopimelate desuccinylase-like protein